MIVVRLFSGTHCSVCTALKPKLIAAIQKDYPEVSIETIDVNEHPVLAAEHRVFTLPVVLIFVAGKEQYRFARSFSVSAVTEKLERLYFLLGK